MDNRPKNDKAEIGQRGLLSTYISSKNGSIPQIYQVRDWIGSTNGPIRSPLRVLNGAILGKVGLLSADVQYLLRVNGQLGSSCKGK